jgi:hypothetical protein
MIRTRVSAVLIARDAVTGRALSRDVTVTLGGEPYRPEYREGGYILFLNLPEGEYEATLKSARYYEERLTITADGNTDGRIVSLRPRAAPRVRRGGLTPGGAVAAVFNRAPEVKTAQIIEPGASVTARLFCRSAGALPPLPAEFLLSDGGDSELCTLRALSADGEGMFSRPFEKAHERGRVLLPCAVYRASADGEAEVSLPAGEAFLFDAEKGELSPLTADA